MDYEIIITLGPASQSEHAWDSLVAAGATAFRINTSHLSLIELQEWLDRLHRFLQPKQKRLPVVLDLQGSKWRLGLFSSRQLVRGTVIDLVYAEKVENTQALPIPHADFFTAAGLSDGVIVINDARIRLRLIHSGPDWIKALVELGGEVSARKGVTYQSSTYRKESLGEKDLAILQNTNHLNFIRYALSYVRDVNETRHFLAAIDSVGSGKSDENYTIAKLERQPALEDAQKIAQLVDEIWLCRGDLGAELGIQRMAKAVHHFNSQIAQFSIPVMLAGQVLEHMVASPTPTRAEVCALYDALVQGYKGVVLSDEIAIGQNPVETCRAAGMFR